MNELSKDAPFIRTKGGQLFTTSIDVAEKFGKQHKDVLRAISNLDCSDEFNGRNFAPVDYLDEKGERRPMFNIARDGFTFLAMGFRGKKAAEWKEKYIAAFSAMEQALLNQKNISWQDQRQQGKIARREITDTIKAFVSYAQSQGSKNAPRYYPTITTTVYKCLFVIEDRYGKSFRDLLSSMQLQFLGVAEYVAAKAIEDGMSTKLPYKEIYKLAKHRVEKYAESLPRTKVISRQISMPTSAQQITA